MRYTSDINNLVGGEFMNSIYWLEFCISLPCNNNNEILLDIIIYINLQLYNINNGYGGNNTFISVSYTHLLHLISHALE